MQIQNGLDTRVVPFNNSCYKHPLSHWLKQEVQYCIFPALCNKPLKSKDFPDQAQVLQADDAK